MWPRCGRIRAGQAATLVGMQTVTSIGTSFVDQSVVAAENLVAFVYIGEHRPQSRPMRRAAPPETRSVQKREIRRRRCAGWPAARGYEAAGEGSAGGSVGGTVG
jgi:hypothetical protein